MKILIIDPPGNLLGVNVGIAYLAGTLKAKGHEPVVLDLPVEPMIAEHEGLDITPETGRAGWDGILPVDYAGAVGHLLELGLSSLAPQDHLP